MGISVEQLLEAPVMRGSRLVAGHDVAAKRYFAWTSVIEWQAVRFVNADELVLTTAIGLDEAMLTTFFQELLQSRAAAICVSLHPSGPVRRLPPALLDEADDRGVPVIDLPWATAFADVNRWAADELLRRRKAATLDEPAHGIPRFTDILLEGGDPNDVAATVETWLARPTLIFNGAMLLIGHGPMAERELNRDAITNLRLRTAKLSPDDAEDLAGRLHHDEPHHDPGEPKLGLPSGTAAAAVARRRLMGFVYVLDDGERTQPLSAIDLAALREAADVIAIDGLRRRAAATADTFDREDFLWQVVRGEAGPPDHIIRRAIDLGLDPRGTFALAVTRIAEADRNGALTKNLREVSSSRRMPAMMISQRDDVVLVLVPGTDSGTHLLREVLEEATRKSGRKEAARWGLAGGPRSLSELAAAFRDARAALQIGSAMGHRGPVADAAELEPFMLLGGVARDPHVADVALTVVQPLVNYDLETGRDLLRTIETYLATGGNASSTARQLTLNRHSLIYRLRKFEELTGRDLNDPADRFVVDLSIKLFRLRALSTAGDQG
jgi:PucR family transcriptional regulator, purine catabolism regulatory protein